MSVTVTLRQEKITLSDKFVSVSWITAANPSGYYPLFVVSENIGDPASERFERVATLNDLATYEENPLIVLRDPGAFGSLGAIAGDKIQIVNPPDYWWHTYLPEDTRFVVSAVHADYLTIQSGVPFPTALGDVQWILRNAAQTIYKGGGSSGQCTRQDLTGPTTYLRRHLTRHFTEVKAASDHVEAVSSFIQALIDDANEDVDQFSGIETEVIS